MKNLVNKEVNKIKEGYLEMIKNLDPDYFVTLTFAYDVNLFYAQQTMNKYLHHVNKAIYGRNKEKLRCFSFIEEDSLKRLHYHLLIKNPSINRSINLKNILYKKWISLKGTGYSSFNGDGWFREMKTSKDKTSVAKYVIKQTTCNRFPLDNLN